MAEQIKASRVGVHVWTIPGRPSEETVLMIHVQLMLPYSSWLTCQHIIIVTFVVG